MAVSSQLGLPQLNLLQVGWQKVEGGYVVVQMEEGVFYFFQGVSASIWQLIVDGQDEEGLVQGLLQSYRVDEQVLRSDVCQFLAELARCKLLS